MTNAKSGAAGDPEPLQAHKAPPIDRYCDLILTGGVTDGLVYPWAIVELARSYRFRSIGGTSIGALAAALTAAAEYGRRTYNSLDGFNEVLLKMPGKLAACSDGKTKLYSLFQATKETTRLFKLFVFLFKASDAGSGNQSRPTIGAPAAQSRGQFLAKAAGAVVRAYWTHRVCVALVLITAAVLLVIEAVVLFLCSNETLDLRQSLAVLVPLLACIALVWVCSIPLALLWDIAFNLVPNNFGMCKGSNPESKGADDEALMDWLHEGIQGACYKKLDEPLTFEDLWDAPCGPPPAAQPSGPLAQKSRSIDLRMIATNVTNGRPLQFPPTEEPAELYFRIDEWKGYFPQYVLDYLCEITKCDRIDVPGNTPLLRLPTAKLPIIVAVRLSSSFPVLFSAVPLWVVDDNEGEPCPRQCWFSDGGICSGFPIHLFDAPIPDWPTFGIWLGTQYDPEGENVKLPEAQEKFEELIWNDFGNDIAPQPQAKESTWALGKRLLEAILGYFWSIISTARGWGDVTTLQLPGVKDRVVQVLLDQGENGLNLAMDPPQIMEFSRVYGVRAGRELVERFDNAASPGRITKAWSEHRWIRFNILLTTMRDRILGLRQAAENSAYSERMSTQIKEAVRSSPLAQGGTKLSGMQSDSLEHLLDAVEGLEYKIATESVPQPIDPKQPKPVLRIRPTI
jgi:predicted acylesterase/phospholipase RssA